MTDRVLGSVAYKLLALRDLRLELCALRALCSYEFHALRDSCATAGEAGAHRVWDGSSDGSRQFFWVAIG